MAKNELLTDAQFNAPQNQNRDNAIIGYRPLLSYHPLYKETLHLPDEPGSIRVMCHMCDGAGCKESVTCENGTEVLPF